MNLCKHCGKLKEFSSMQYCEKCSIEKYKKDVHKAKERQKIYERKRYLSKTIEERKKLRKRKRKWAREYHRKRYNYDSNFRMRVKLGNLLSHALKKYYTTKKINKSIKYNINYKDIIEHLKPFPKPFKKYQVDHIIPLCAFDLTIPQEIQRAFAPKNLQWLSIKNNIKKTRKDRHLSIHNHKRTYSYDLTTIKWCHKA